MEDGRKSFRTISRELKISTPTIKARYDRLVNIGLIKSVKPVLDLSKVTKQHKSKFSKDDLLSIQEHNKQSSVKISNLNVKMTCEFCGGPIHKKPLVLKFADLERFFCCTSCKNDYKSKYGGRIQSLIEQHREKKKKN